MIQRNRPDVIVLADLIQALCLKALTCAGVAEASGMSVTTATRHVAALHEHRRIHIAEWGKDSRGFYTVKFYRWGNLPDAPHPLPPTTSTDRVRAMRARKRETAS